MSKLDDIKAKILALKARIQENGASEAEAMAALSKAEKLMLEYDLTEEDLLLAKHKEDFRSGKFQYGIKTQHPCSKYCGGVISRFCGVRSWFDQSKNSSHAFGFDADVTMYEFLMKMIHDTMNREWKDYIADHPPRMGVTRHTEYWSFMLGMSNRINKKIHELIKEREIKVASNGTALIVLKNSLIEAGMKEAFPDLFFKNSKGRGILADASSLAKGAEAGNRVNLSRPLRDQVDKSRMLK